MTFDVEFVRGLVDSTQVYCQVDVDMSRVDVFSDNNDLYEKVTNALVDRLSKEVGFKRAVNGTLLTYDIPPFYRRFRLMAAPA